MTNSIVIVIFLNNNVKVLLNIFIECNFLDRSMIQISDRNLF